MHICVNHRGGEAVKPAHGADCFACVLGLPAVVLQVIDHNHSISPTRQHARKNRKAHQIQLDHLKYIATTRMNYLRTVIGWIYSSF